MEIVKLLERQSVIRFFGIGLIASPFFNTFLTILSLPVVQDRWSWRVFWFITSNRAFVDQLLYVTTFIIGILMLRGATWAWKCLLVLLGGYILNQTLHFGQNFRANKLSAVFFLMNVGIFLFIADQLAWKIKKAIPKNLFEKTSSSSTGIKQTKSNTNATEAAAAVAATNHVAEAEPEKKSRSLSQRSLQSSKKHFIYFSNLGPWAKLVEISKDGIRVECITTPPQKIESEDIEFSLGANAHFRIRFVESHKDIFLFKFQQLSAKDIQALNDWLYRQAA